MERFVVNPSLRASPRFRRFWFARLLSHSAQNAILLALLVTVVNRTGSTIHSSLLVLTFVVPSALLGFAGGLAVDRLAERELLITTGLFRTALCLLFLRSNEGVLAIYVTNASLAVLTQFATPAESSALPELVPVDQVVPATAALNVEIIASQLLGTVLLAPLLIKTVGLRPLFVLAACSYLASTVAYARIPGLGRRPEGLDLAAPAPRSRGRPLDALRTAALETWQLVRSDRAIFLSVVEQTLVATTSVVLISIIPVYTRRLLHLPAEDSVAVFSPAAVGMFLSMRLIPRLAGRVEKPRLVSAGFACFVVLLGLLGFSPELTRLLRAHDPIGLIGLHALAGLYSPVWLSVLLAGPMGFAYGIVLVAARAILYERVPAPMQGRVFAFQGVLGNVASIVPLILVGVVAYWLGPRVVLVLVMMVDVAAAAYAIRVVSAGSGASTSGSDEEGQPFSGTETG